MNMVRHGLDAGEYSKCTTQPEFLRGRKAGGNKKRGSRSSPLSDLQTFLVGQRFRCWSVVTRHGAVVHHESQIAHRQVARADVADESEAVRILEVTQGEHVARETRGRSGGQGRIDHARRDVAGV